MAKIVKKYANGGSYFVEESPKKTKEVVVPKATPPIVGWNIPSMQPDKK